MKGHNICFYADLTEVNRYSNALTKYSATSGECHKFGTLYCDILLEACRHLSVVDVWFTLQKALELGAE